ncbi:MAG: hypothetical protein WC803_11640 [Sphingomonas sp.]|jgi:hypothetical protein
MTKFPVIQIDDNVARPIWPETRGRVEGSKNQSTVRRDEAVSKGVAYVEGGMKTKHAAQRCIDDLGINVTVEHMSRLITQSRRLKCST